jgi:hypothetical protein
VAITPTQGKEDYKMTSLQKPTKSDGRIMIIESERCVHVSKQM